MASGLLVKLLHYQKKKKPKKNKDICDVMWFQRYEQLYQLKDAKNNRKQKTFSALFNYLKIDISDFRLILLDHITFLY